MEKRAHVKFRHQIPLVMLVSAGTGNVVHH